MDPNVEDPVFKSNITVENVTQFARTHALFMARIQLWHPRDSDLHLASANGRFFRERQERRGEVFTLKDRFHGNFWVYL